MIRCAVKSGESLTALEGLPPPGQDGNVIWLEVNAPTAEESSQLRERFAIETRSPVGNVVEDGALMYLRSQLIALAADGSALFANVTFVLAERFVATLCDEPGFRPFGVVLNRCSRKPSNAESAKALLRALLQAANDNASAAVDRVAEGLEQSTAEISQFSEGYNEQGQELGVSDLSGTLRSLNEKEELILRCIESQLTLARTVRYLSGEVDNRSEG